MDMTTLLGMAIAATPLLAIAGLLRLADWIQSRRDARYARQIALTDAIHRELGAVTAPTVTPRRGGGWLVQMVVPFDRPAMVAAILGITDRAFASRETSGGLQVVLVPAPRSTLTGADRSPSARPRSIESGAPALALR
jgi:hypothetical protein